MKSMERCEGMQQSVRGGQKKILIMLCPVFFIPGISFVLKRNAGNKNIGRNFEKFSVTFFEISASL